LRLFFQFFLALAEGGVLQGVFEKMCGFEMVFCGEVVVICWCERGFLYGGFRGLRKCHLLKIFLWKFETETPRFGLARDRPLAELNKNGKNNDNSRGRLRV